MKFGRLEIKFAKKDIGSAVPRAGRWHRILEPFSGAWQRNVVVDNYNCLLANSAVYACATRIANDIAKMPILLVEREDGIWSEVENSPFWPVIRKPNEYQNRIQFYVVWLLSILLRGNTYVLKVRDGRNMVIGLHILDASRVTVRITPTGRVFYQLTRDDLAGVGGDQVNVPASEIIHDLMNPLFHPLCGVSPLYACAWAATLGNKIQTNSASFFDNSSTPSGTLTAPGELTDEQAEQWAQKWKEQFTGANRGKVAILGNGLKYEKIEVTAEDSQLIEQLRFGVEDVARAFGVPLYKINAGPVPISNNVEALNSLYYSDTLQPRIEAIELCLDEGLGLTKVPGQELGVEFDLDGLLRMDSSAQMDMLSKAVGGAIMAPNEARAKRSLPPVKGGESPYLQQQNYSLAALAARDSGADPFGTAAPPPPEAAPPAANDEDVADEARMFAVKGFGC